MITKPDSAAIDSTVMSVISGRPHVYQSRDQTCVSVEGVAMPYKTWVMLVTQEIFVRPITMSKKWWAAVFCDVEPVQEGLNIPTKFIHQNEDGRCPNMPDKHSGYDFAARAVAHLFSKLRKQPDAGQKIKEMVAQVEEDYAAIFQSHSSEMTISTKTDGSLMTSEA